MAPSYQQEASILVTHYRAILVGACLALAVLVNWPSSSASSPSSSSSIDFFTNSDDVDFVRHMDKGWAILDAVEKNRANGDYKEIVVHRRFVNVTLKLSSDNLADNTLTVFYLECTPTSSMHAPAGTLLLVHGMAINKDGTADVWMEVDTMRTMAARGYRVIAPDMPGTAMSRTATMAIDDDGKARFVENLLAALNVEKVILCGASWGGGFVLPFTVDHPSSVVALIAVCPVGAQLLSSEKWQSVTTKTLVIHGDLDRRLGHDSYAAMKSMPNLRHVSVAGASHAVFQQRPRPFHAAVFAFLEELKM